MTDPYQTKCIGCFVAYTLNTIAFLVAFGSPNWFRYSISQGNIHVIYNTGLWATCYVIPDVSSGCDNIDLASSPAWFQVTCAFMIMALIIAIAAGGTRMYMPVSAGLEIFAGLCTLVAIIIYGMSGVMSYSSSGNIGYAYILSICCCLTYFTNGITLLVFAGKSGCDMTNQLRVCCEPEAVVDTV